MKRILFDQNVPQRLARHLAPHHVEISFERGWSTLGNGDLVEIAERSEFETLITADQNLAYQQNLSSRRLAIIVLDTNRWPVIVGRISRIRAAIDATTPGSFETLSIFGR